MTDQTGRYRLAWLSAARRARGLNLILEEVDIRVRQADQMARLFDAPAESFLPLEAVRESLARRAAPNGDES